MISGDVLPSYWNSTETSAKVTEILSFVESHISYNFSEETSTAYFFVATDFSQLQVLKLT